MEGCEETVWEASPLEEKEVSEDQFHHLFPSFHPGSGKSVYQCDICSKMYSTKYGLQRHLKSHRPGGIKCNICHIYFSSMDSQNLHHQKFHPGPHLCPSCGKSFTRKSSLKFHILRNHDESYQAQYKCEVGECRRFFHTKKAFQEHVNVHAKLKPYICDKCRKQFTLSASMTRHKRSCMENKKFTCTETNCGKQFESTGALSNHKQSVHEHKLYPCSCGKVFKYSPGLITHKKVKGHL